MKWFLCWLGIHDMPPWSEPYDGIAPGPVWATKIHGLIQKRCCRTCHAQKVRRAE